MIYILYISKLSWPAGGSKGTAQFQALRGSLWGLVQISPVTMIWMWYFNLKYFPDYIQSLVFQIWLHIRNTIQFQALRGLV